MVKILAIGDPHGILPKNLDKIVKKNKIDLIVCVGDWGFTPKKPWLEESWKGLPKNYAVKTAKQILKKLDSFNIPLLSLQGNMFLSKEGRKLISPQLLKMKNLIKKYTGKKRFLGQNFIFFDVLSEAESTRTKMTKKKLERANSKKRRLNDLLKENPNSILITHNPPYGLVDKAYNGKHVGSKIIRDAIKKHKPKLVLCGHIHEAKGKGKIGKIPVYNLGWHGDYIVIDSETLKVSESNFLK